MKLKPLFLLAIAGLVAFSATGCTPTVDTSGTQIAEETIELPDWSETEWLTYTSKSHKISFKHPPKTYITEQAADIAINYSSTGPQNSDNADYFLNGTIHIFANETVETYIEEYEIDPSQIERVTYNDIEATKVSMENKWVLPEHDPADFPCYFYLVEHEGELLDIFGHECAPIEYVLENLEFL